jgi:hypothetical protein
MRKKLTRFEVNKCIRQICARHRVDMGVTSFQTLGYEIVITGILWHTDDTDFDAIQVETLVKDFQSTLVDFQIRGETENWYFNGSSIKSVYSPKFENVLDEEASILEQEVLLKALEN